MLVNDLASRVLNAIKGDKEAIKRVSEALVSRNPAELRRVLSQVANVDITHAEAEEVVRGVGSDAEKVVAYWT
jgi:hypothetical protein